MSGYDGIYDVSNMGDVRSWRQWRDRQPGDLLRPGISSGKRTVVLYKDGKGTTRLVCHLVLEEFTGPREPGQVCRHGPGGSRDDRHVNLCWGSQADNVGPDKVRDGTSNRGERQWLAQLTETAVTDCRRRYAAGERLLGELAAEHGVSGATMSNAISGRNWGWLPGAVPIDPARRGRRGTAHPQAKLTWPQVREIRLRAAAGERQGPLAGEFGVSQAVISSIVRGRTWREPAG